MEGKIILKTPKKWTELLSDLNLAHVFDDCYLELSTAHLHHPSLKGVYTSYGGLRPVHDRTTSQFKGYEVRVESRTGSEGEVMDLDSFSPVIVPNPMHIDFELRQERDLAFALDFLRKFNDVGYRPDSLHRGLYFQVWSNRDHITSVTMGHQSTTLFRDAKKWFSQQDLELLVEKYGIFNAEE